MTRVAVVGASGFVGRAAATALAGGGHEVVEVSAPRLRCRTSDPAAIAALASEQGDACRNLSERFAGCYSVVNAAGDPDASSNDQAALLGANALLPAVVAEAALHSGVVRLVHVSSAVVQADRPVLDDTAPAAGFSAYSTSKVAGEQVLYRYRSEYQLWVTAYRPPSVHSTDRRVSRLISRIARSPLASVAGLGDQASPQALIANVGSAIAFLAVCTAEPPAVVHHPSEGLTARDVMVLFGAGRTPKRLPPTIATALVGVAKFGGRLLPALSANARRVEILWLGQQQAASWLTAAGWTPPVGRDGWAALGQELSVARQVRRSSALARPI